MNRERAKELLPIIQAFAEGKDIQMLNDAANKWRACDDPAWFDHAEYRIKPERRKVWVLFYKDHSGAFADPSETYIRKCQQQYGGKVVCVEEPD